MRRLEIATPPGRQPRFRWSAREVLRDLHGVPHLLVRVSLSGPYVPPRSGEPFAVVGNVRSRFVLLVDGGLRANAYFDCLLPEGGLVAFGYGRRVRERFPGPFRSAAVARLDRSRLPRGTVFPDEV